VSNAEESPGVKSVSGETQGARRLMGAAPSLNFQAYVFAWDQAMLRVSGSALFTSAIMSGPAGAGFNQVMIPEQPLAPVRVRAMDADGGVEAEAAAGLPGEHVLNGVLVEEPAALEEAEHASLQRALEAENVVCTEMRRLVEGDAAVVALGEDAVEDNYVEVEVGIQGGAEAVEEGDGAEPGVAGRGRGRYRKGRRRHRHVRSGCAADARQRRARGQARVRRCLRTATHEAGW
jgi:hypothetical protein